MGDSHISNSEQEQYLGDMINQEGCAASITATIKERMRKLTSKCHKDRKGIFSSKNQSGSMYFRMKL